MKILMIGDVTGSPGRLVVAQVIARMRRENAIDFTVANAENAAAGRGITPKLAEELFACGVDVITMGDHVWDQKELVAGINREPRIIRPANFAPGCPGRGYVTVDTAHGAVTVFQFIGRVFLKPNDCPFRMADQLLGQGGYGKIKLVDFHAEATSEKIVFGRYVDGRVSAVVGTHTHVQTADEVILPGGTAYITDLGMTGVTNSAIGRELAPVTETFLKGMPAKFDMAKGDAVLHGVIVDVDPQTGRSRKITRVREGMSGPAKTAFG
jgi:2',3'-cyclic-nucleotide 2'-phosphodiesterase